MANEATIDLIKISEGFQPKRYNCPAGYPTIGYGTRIFRSIDTELWDSIITEETATSLLLDAVKGIEEFIDGVVDVPLTENQRGALVDFIYNLGPERLRGSTLLRHLNHGDYKAAAAEFLRWRFATDPHTGVKVSMPGLVRRREAEQKLFETP